MQTNYFNKLYNDHEDVLKPDLGSTAFLKCFYLLFSSSFFLKQVTTSDSFTGSHFIASVKLCLLCVCVQVVRQ